MRIGILDLDTKKEKMGHGKHEKFPNLACGKIYGYHMMQGDVVVYPWNGEKVDKLYVSSIFSWTRPAIAKLLPFWQERADEVIVGGTGHDYKSVLPSEIESVPNHYTYDLYDIDYGIGFTVRGCHVGCGFCVVWRKEGLQEYRVARIGDLVNPRSNHLVLLNNNSLADIGFFEDVEEIRQRKLTVNWNQANDITLVTPKHAEALASVEFRNFACTSKMLHFACDQVKRTKIVKLVDGSPVVESLNHIPKEFMTISEIPIKHDGVPALKVTYDMLKVVPEKVRLMKEYGIKPYQLSFYLLIGFDTTLEEDLARFHMLNDLGCNVYAMQFRDLNGRPFVDGKGNPQSPHVKHFKRYVNGHAFRSCRFEDFEPYVAGLNKSNQMTLF